MIINHPSILKGIFDWLKILYVTDFKRNTANTGAINRHSFHERARLRSIFCKKYIQFWAYNSFISFNINKL